MRSVFISRTLTGHSPLKRRLSAAGFQVHGESLIRFSGLPFDKLPESDWIFFYSSNGLRFLLEELDRKKMKLPVSVKLAAMGKGTAASMVAMGLKPDFVGHGRPDATARAFLRVAEGQNILFARALRSAKSVQNLLSPYINIVDLPVYKNDIRLNVDIPYTDYVILTSSMNVDAFFQSRRPDARQTYLAIGRPTALRYGRWISQEVYVPDQPSEEALAELILELDQKNKKK